jgi:hypothetical protein
MFSFQENFIAVSGKLHSILLDKFYKTSKIPVKSSKAVADQQSPEGFSGDLRNIVIIFLEKG